MHAWVWFLTHCWHLQLHVCFLTDGLTLFVSGAHAFPFTRSSKKKHTPGKLYPYLKCMYIFCPFAVVHFFYTIKVLLFFYVVHVFFVTCGSLFCIFASLLIFHFMPILEMHVHFWSLCCCTFLLAQSRFDSSFLLFMFCL